MEHEFEKGCRSTSGIAHIKLCQLILAIQVGNSFITRRYLRQMCTSPPAWRQWSGRRGPYWVWRHMAREPWRWRPETRAAFRTRTLLGWLMKNHSHQVWNCPQEESGSSRERKVQCCVSTSDWAPWRPPGRVVWFIFSPTLLPNTWPIWHQHFLIAFLSLWSDQSLSVALFSKSSCLVQIHLTGMIF